MTVGTVTKKPAQGAWTHAHDGNALVVLLMGRRYALPHELTVSADGRFAQRAAMASDGCDRSVWQFVVPALPAGQTTIAIESLWPNLVDGAAVSLTRVDVAQPVLMTEITRCPSGALQCSSRAVPSGQARTLVIENGESGGRLPGVVCGTMLARDDQHGQWIVAADVAGDVTHITTERQKNPFDVPLVHLNVTYRPVSG